MGGRFFGTILAFVPGEQAANYKLTGALPVQVLKELTRSFYFSKSNIRGAAKG
jgi:hypothetical protein